MLKSKRKHILPIALSVFAAIAGTIMTIVVDNIMKSPFMDHEKILKILSYGFGLLTSIFFIVIAEFINSSYARTSLNDEVIKSIQEKSNNILHTISNTRGIVRLRDIKTSMEYLAPIMSKICRVRDITFRTDGVDPNTYKGPQIWANAIMENIESIDNYSLIICQQTIEYPKIFYSDHIDSINKLPGNIHLYEAKIEIPYPNFFILYTRENHNLMVVGWPFSMHSTGGDLFLIEDQKVIEYFDKLYTALLEKSERLR